MAIGPIEISGAVTRTQDISTFKQNEDNKAFVDQNNIHGQIEKNVQDKNTNVTKADNSDYHEYRYDAKEKGNGNYQGNGGKKKEKKEASDGRVIVKQSSGFDIKI